MDVRIIYTGLILMVLIMSGCATENKNLIVDGTEIIYSDNDNYDRMYIGDYGRAAYIRLEYGDSDSILLWAFCEDEVVCYEYDGTSCLRHKDLVEKYRKKLAKMQL